MKKLLLVAMLLTVSAGFAFAAVNDTGQITISCMTDISVEVSTSTTYIASDPGITVDMGSVATGATCLAPKPFYVWNTSAANKSTVLTYSLSATVASGGGTNWTLRTTWAPAMTVADEAALAGGFGTAAVIGDFADADSIDGTPSAWSAANHMTTGVATARHFNAGGVPGASGLQLYTALKTPVAVSNSTTKTLTITVAASAAN